MDACSWDTRAAASGAARPRAQSGPNVCITTAGLSVDTTTRPSGSRVAPGTRTEDAPCARSSRSALCSFGTVVTPGPERACTGNTSPNPATPKSRPGAAVAAAEGSAKKSAEGGGETGSAEGTSKESREGVAGEDAARGETDSGEGAARKDPAKGGTAEARKGSMEKASAGGEAATSIEGAAKADAAEGGTADSREGAATTAAAGREGKEFRERSSGGIGKFREGPAEGGAADSGEEEAESEPTDSGEGAATMDAATDSCDEPAEGGGGRDSGKRPATMSSPSSPPDSDVRAAASGRASVGFLRLRFVLAPLRSGV